MASETGRYDITHKPGYCIMDGQRFYNGPARHFYGDVEFFDLVKKVCPMFINSTSPESSTICCDKSQLEVTHNAARIAEAIYENCPACTQNLLQHLCLITCDPNMSVWFDIPPGGMVEFNATTWYVSKLDIYITPHYAHSLYNSCRNVRMPGTTQKAMDITCGGVDKCNARLWISFLGIPTPGVAPTVVQYHINDTVKGNPNIKPNNHTFTTCNTSVLDLQCTCADCPAPNICPQLPMVELSCPKYAIISGAILCIGTMLSICVCIVALIGALLNCNGLARQLPKGPKSYHCFMSHSVTGNTGEGKESPLESDQDVRPLYGVQNGHSYLRHITSFGHYTGSVLPNIFYHWGCFCADHWFLVLLFTAIPITFLGHGLVFLEISSDPVELWSAPESQARIERDYIESKFGPGQRSEQLMINAKPSVQGYCFPPFGIPGYWCYSSLFEIYVLEEVRVTQMLLEVIISFGT